MKVLISMTQFDRPGGAERLDIELAEGLNARGDIEADVVGMYRSDSPGVQPAAEALRRRGVPAVHFLGLDVGPGPLGVLRGTARLRRLIRAGRYDIVHTSMAGPSAMACWACRGTGAGTVVGVHEMYGQALQPGRKATAWRFSIRHNRRARLYAISQRAAQSCAEFANISPGRIRLIYNAVAPEAFDATNDSAGVRRELGIDADSRIALFVGRLLKRKGIDTLLKALGPILTDLNVTLVYVGPQCPPEGLYPREQGLLERMRARIAAEGWSPNVRFLGRRDDVPRLMASANVLVHPARVEGFGLVLAEAMAAALPVVASNVGGIPEVLAGTKAIMVPPDDPERLRQAVIDTLARTHAQRGEAAKLGRRRAECFHGERRVQDMVRLFDDTLAGRP